jgi:hypothetical protein
MMRKFLKPVGVLLILLLTGCICAVNPKELSFDETEVTNTFTLWIPGGEENPTSWSIDATVDWITVEPMMGRNYGDNTISVTVDRAGLEPGIYSGRLCINTEHAVCACKVEVTMEVAEESPGPYPDTGKVEGTVYDAVTDNGIPGVIVGIDSIFEVITEELGYYVLNDVPPGFYTIHAFKEGYYDYFGEISVVSNLTTTHDILLFLIEDVTSTTTSTVPTETTTTTTSVQMNQACCLIDGSCLDVAPDYCEGTLNGVPQGPETTCAIVDCPQLTVSCCLPNGTCADLIEDNCQALGGSYFPNFSCSNLPIDCQPEACCLEDGSCKDEITYFCDDDLGVSQGPGTTCAIVSCPQP